MSPTSQDARLLYVVPPVLLTTGVALALWPSVAASHGPPNQLGVFTIAVAVCAAILAMGYALARGVSLANDSVADRATRLADWCYRATFAAAIMQLCLLLYLGSLSTLHALVAFPVAFVVISLGFVLAWTTVRIGLAEMGLILLIAGLLTSPVGRSSYTLDVELGQSVLSASELPPIPVALRFAGDTWDPRKARLYLETGLGCHDRERYQLVRRADGTLQPTSNANAGVLGQADDDGHIATFLPRRLLRLGGGRLKLAYDDDDSAEATTVRTFLVIDSGGASCRPVLSRS